jgi:hypothetical protein
MSTVEVKVATNIRASGPNPVVLYTVPAGKQAVVRTVNITNTTQNSASISPVLGLRRSGSITTLSSPSIASAASANMLTAPITMIAGDELVTTETAADTFGEVVTALFPDGTSSAIVAIVDSNTIICCNSSGIYRSTNAGVAFTQVSSLSCSSAVRAAKIGTDYFIYQSTTSAYRSTDSGATWTTQAVTNAPSTSAGNCIAAPGRIVYNGSVYGCLTSTSQLSTTTDGITWTNVAAAFPATVDSLVWSGTHWVGGADGSRSIYRSTNGASWSTVTARTANSGENLGGIATNGAGVIITGTGNGGNVIGRSADHGATWSDLALGFTGAASSSNSTVNYIGSNFYVFTNSTNATNYSPTALTGSFVNTGALSTFANTITDSYGVNGTNVFYTRIGLRRFPLTIPTAFAGMDVAAAILEVTP